MTVISQRPLPRSAAPIGTSPNPRAIRDRKGPKRFDELERVAVRPGEPRPVVDFPLSYRSNKGLLWIELDHLKEQGLDETRTAALATEIAELPRQPKPQVFNRWWKALGRISDELAVHEPTDYAAIRAQCPPAPVVPVQKRSREEIAARMEAAWTGRAAGCLLGKPVEGWGRQKIEGYLRDIGEYPLAQYIPADAEAHEKYGFHPSWPRSGRQYIDGAMPRDDDMDYPIIGLMTLERCGEGFTTADIAQTWKSNLPFERTYTAERMAYANLTQGMKATKAGAWANPYREWIGAQIRADIWAYVNPGNPERAAEMAWRDAVVSHTGNGVYGEMFFAALISAAFTAESLDEALDLATAQVPAHSRFAEMVKNVREWERSGLDWDACWQRISETYGELHWVHTLNNAALALAGLLYGKGDFERTITLTVRGGLDTDSNGATVGSVFGALHGPDAIPEKWSGPLAGTLHSAVFGHSEVRFSDLVKRAMAFVPAGEGEAA